MTVTLDRDDERVYAEAFNLAPAVHTFLRRRGVRSALEGALLDGRVDAADLDRLVEADRAMHAARIERLFRARNPEPDGWPSRFHLWRWGR